MAGTTLTYDDTFGAIAKGVSLFLTASQELRLEGLEYQDSTKDQWVYLTVEFDSFSRTGDTAPADGTVSLEVYSRVSITDIFKNQELMETLRSGLQDSNLKVMGKASGSPLVVRGYIQFTTVSCREVGATEGIQIGEITANFIGRT